MVWGEERMIYGFFGSIPGCYHQRGTQSLRGNGKTLSMTFVGYMDYVNGRKVLSNYHTSFSTMKHTEELINYIQAGKLRNVTVLISEMQAYLNSMGISKAKNELFISQVVAQSRKRSVDIHYDAQRYGDVHVRLRVQTDRAFLPRKYHLDGQPCSIDRCGQEHVIKLWQHDPFLETPVITLNCEECGKLYDSDEIVI